MGFKKAAGWMAVFIHEGPNGDSVTFIVYVDDLVMLGGPRMINIIEAVREHIEMDDPADLQKYLGVYHAKEVVAMSGHELTWLLQCDRGAVHQRDRLEVEERFNPQRPRLAGRGVH